MRVMMNGQMYEMPADEEGAVDSDDLRQVSGVTADRPLVVQRRDGNQLINPGEKVMVKPGEHFMDAPAHRRGDAQRA